MRKGAAKQYTSCEWMIYQAANLDGDHLDTRLRSGWVGFTANSRFSKRPMIGVIVGTHGAIYTA